MTDGTSPTARALVALELIQARPGISGAQLASRLGVSDRAARRYVAILREAGIPVESVSGPAGGYRLGRGFRLPPLMFSTAEALALVMAVLAGGARATDGDDPVGRALNKIIRVLPAPVAEPADALRRVERHASDGHVPGPSPETTAVLVQAAASGRRLRLDYRTPAGNDRVMEVDPWGLTRRYDRWYLLCWSHTAEARRVLRVDRVVRVDVLREVFDPPPGLDTARAVEEHLAEGRRHEIEVLIEAPYEVVSRRVPRHLGRLEDAGDGRTRLLGTTDDLAWYAQRLLGVEAPFTVVGPPELRAEAYEVGQRLMAAGSPDATTSIPP